MDAPLNVEPTTPASDAPARRLAAAWLALRQSALLGDAGVYVAANLLNALVPFLLVPVLTRHLEPSQYGLFAMFGVAVNVLAAFVGVNANSAATVRYFQLTPDRMREYLGTCLAILAVSTMLILVLARPALSLAMAVSSLPAMWLVIAVLVAAANFVTSLRLLMWQVQGRAWHYSALVVAQNVANIGIAIALVVGAGHDWRGAAWGQVVGAALAATLSFALLWRAEEVTFRVKLDDVRDALRYGLPLTPHLVGGLLIAGADRVLVANLLGLREAGIYLVALQIGMALGVLTGAFNKAYMPWLLKRLRTPDRVRDRAIVLGTYAYALLLLGMATALALLAPFLVRVIAGPEFRDAAHVVKWIAFAYAFGGMYYMVTNYVFHAGRTSWLAWVTLGSGLVGLSTSALLIPRFGIDGAGMGYLVSNLLMFLGTWVVAHRVHPMPWALALRPSVQSTGSS